MTSPKSLIVIAFACATFGALEAVHTHNVRARVAEACERQLSTILNDTDRSRRSIEEQAAGTPKKHGDL